MEISECLDPQTDPIDGSNLTFPTNTFYPPGLVCAKEFARLFCPSSGESGSPLMIRNEESRFVAVGFLSFIKGCDVFAFGAGNTRVPPNRYFLNQFSQNPSAYTKLSCFLPWIAKEYSLKFTPSGDPDPACTMGTGDINDVTNPSISGGDFICRNTPSNLLEAGTDVELPCIFPYYFDGHITETDCVQFNQGGLNFPTFVCPTRNITTKIDGFSSFSSEDLTIILVGGFCQDFDAQGNDELPPLNPDINDCGPAQRRVPFSQCKNNCPGGENITKYLAVMLSTKFQ